MPFRVDPLLVGLATDERPQPVAFRQQGRAGDGGRLEADLARNARVQRVHAVLQPTPGHIRHAGDGALGQTLQQESPYQRLLPVRNLLFFRF